MDLSSIAGVVKKFAPLLGTVLGGPIGTAAGGLVSIVADKFDVDPDEAQANPDILAAAIGADPEAKTKLIELQLTHKTRIEELLLERDKAYLADVQDARGREMAIVKATGKKDINLYLLAWTIIIGFFALTGLLMKFPLPTGSNQVVFMLFGALASGFGIVLQYFFGSSRSSQAKTQLMATKGIT